MGRRWSVGITIALSAFGARSRALSPGVALSAFYEIRRRLDIGQFKCLSKVRAPDIPGINGAKVTLSMDDIQKNIVTLLRKAVERLREAKLPEELAAQLEQYATQVNQPCVVAVVGQVKAGKSTFINAFLGEDLAKVGTTETTATINYFRYGKIASDKPVRCFWRGGRDDYRLYSGCGRLKKTQAGRAVNEWIE